MTELSIPELEALVKEKKEQDTAKFHHDAWNMALLLLCNVYNNIIPEYSIQEIRDKYNTLSAPERAKVIKKYREQIVTKIQWALDNAIDAVVREREEGEKDG